MRDQIVAWIGRLGPGKAFSAKNFSQIPAVPAVPSTETTLSADSSYSSTRLTSLDLFRGVTIAAMILVNNPGNDHPYWPLEHAEWNGWTPTDLIFPFFVSDPLLKELRKETAFNEVLTTASECQKTIPKSRGQ